VEKSKWEEWRSWQIMKGMHKRVGGNALQYSLTLVVPFPCL
jgi:hypothetical protein